MHSFFSIFKELSPAFTCLRLIRCKNFYGHFSQDPILSAADIFGEAIANDEERKTLFQHDWCPESTFSLFVE